MKYNTPKQRKKIYEKILKMWINDKNIYDHICGDIRILINDINSTDFVLVEKFPELKEQKPKNKPTNSFWWIRESSQPRIKALKAAIKLCE